MWEKQGVHLLTAWSGELVSLVEPLCDDRGCTGCAGLVGLGSAQLVEFATVVDRPDCGTAELVSAAVAFLKRTGWVDKDPEVLAEFALDMAALTTEAASWYPLGTKVRALFNGDTDEWIVTCANQCGDGGQKWPTLPPSIASSTAIFGPAGMDTLVWRN